MTDGADETGTQRQRHRHRPNQTTGPWILASRGGGFPFCDRVLIFYLSVCSGCSAVPVVLDDWSVSVVSPERCLRPTRRFTDQEICLATGPQTGRAAPAAAAA